MVEDVAAHILETMNTGGLGRWTRATANEAGLDLVCARPFEDRRGGRPLFFLQCASGANWRDKLRTPDIRCWSKLIDFSNDPQRGFAVPFSLLKDEFRRSCCSVNGMLLDRHRLLSIPTDKPSGWIPEDLRENLLAWLRPRVEALPFHS